MPRTLSVQPPIHTTEASGPPGSHQIPGVSRMELQQESQFTQLPPEVLLLIIDHLNTAGKISLLATCQYLRRLSEPLLYHHLTPDGSWKSCRRIQLLKTLGERQDLLPFIHSFRGHLIPTSIRRPSQQNEEADSKPRTPLQDEWFAISAPLLFQAINIRDLEFTDGIDWQANGRWELFKSAIANMKLHSLGLCSTSKTSLDLTPILREQPELTRLELTCPTAHFEGLEKSDVQKLKVFGGTWQQAATIIPGRPVGRLDLGCGDTDECHCQDEHIFQKLLQSSETVREFKVRAHTVSDDTRLRGVLQLIIRYLPKIVNLTIVAKGEISAQTLLEEIPKFSMISSLMILDAWFNPFAGAPSADFNDWGIYTWENVSEKLKELCPSLGDVGYTPQLRFGCGFAYQNYRLSRQAYL